MHEGQLSRVIELKSRDAFTAGKHQAAHDCLVDAILAQLQLHLSKSKSRQPRDRREQRQETATWCSSWISATALLKISLHQKLKFVR
jgi:hypothetical protein